MNISTVLYYAKCYLLDEQERLQDKLKKSPNNIYLLQFLEDCQKDSKEIKDIFEKASPFELAKEFKI